MTVKVVSRLEEVEGGLMTHTPMTSESEVGRAGVEAEGACRGLSAAAALAVGAAFLGLWFWLLPGWLGFEVRANDGETWRWVAAIPSVVGFAVALRCIWDFGWTGRGTPAPMIPPKRLVVVGPYRYMRNPMYLGFAAGWI